VNKYTKHCQQQEHVTLTIPQKLETINRLESVESQREFMASYNIGSATISNIKKETDQS
jgi:hypothetical protein